MQHLLRSVGFPVLGIGFLLACATPPGQGPPADGRTALQLAPEAQEAVLLEMRNMLTSLNGVLRGLASSDSAAMHRAALASGLATAADPALEKVLPQAFMQLGTATHEQFDSLAATIAAGVSRDSVVAQLARLTTACVSCHSTYRLSRP